MRSRVEATAKTSTERTSTRLPRVVATPSEAARDIHQSSFDRAIVSDTSRSYGWDAPPFAGWQRSGSGANRATLNTTPRARARFARRVLVGRQLRAGDGRAEVMAGQFRWHPGRFSHRTMAADVDLTKREGKLASLASKKRQSTMIVGTSSGSVRRARCHRDHLHHPERSARPLSRTDGHGLSSVAISCVDKMHELGTILNVARSDEGTTSDSLAFSKRPVAFAYIGNPGWVTGVDHVGVGTIDAIRSIEAAGARRDTSCGRAGTTR